MSGDEASLRWSATWQGEKAQITLVQGVEVLFVDKCDPSSAEARNRMFTRLAGKFPAVEREPIEARLLAMAADAPSEQPPAEGAFALPPNPPAWEGPVHGAALLNEIVALLERYLVLPDHAATAVALWVVHTYVFEKFTYSPRLLVSSPEKRCGKSLLLRFVAALVAHPLSCENISSAALYRSIEKFAPTLLLDEADTFLAGKNANEEMRGIINAGFARGGCVVRCVGDDLEPTPFNVFGPLALGMIGKPQGTIEDRSVVVQMRRKLPGDRVEKVPPGRPLRDLVSDTVRRIVRWTADHGAELATASPTVPARLDDRAGDCWFSLLAIADAVRGSWPEQARIAAVALSEGRDAPGSLPLMLLTDLRVLFAERQAERLRTDAILEHLQSREDRPWLDFRQGRPITARQLARMLEPFDVRPDKWKAGHDTERGYTAADFVDAWSRYLPVGIAPAMPPQASHHAGSEAGDDRGEWRLDPPPPTPVADGGGTVAAPGGGTSACPTERWRQVADADAPEGGEVGP